MKAQTLQHKKLRPFYRLCRRCDTRYQRKGKFETLCPNCYKKSLKWKNNKVMPKHCFGVKL